MWNVVIEVDVARAGEVSSSPNKEYVSRHHLPLTVSLFAVLDGDASELWHIECFVGTDLRYPCRFKEQEIRVGPWGVGCLACDGRPRGC